MTRHRKAFGWVCGFLWLAFIPQIARAYEEQGSVDLALGGLLVPNSNTLETYGASIDVGASLGISDMFVVRAAGGYAAQPDRHGGVRGLGRARAEFMYLLDIVRWVPFFGLGASLWLYDNGESFQARPGGHVVLGLDFLLNRSWTFGLDLRSGLLLEADDNVSYSEAQLRISRMFDTF